MAATIGTFEIERTVPMNMYSLSKGRCCLISIIGLLLGITVIIVGFMGPPIFVVEIAPSNISSMITQSDRFIYSQTLNAPSFSRFNRQLWFKAFASIDDSKSASISIPLNMSIVFQPLNVGNDSLTPSRFSTERMLRCSDAGICDPFDVIRFVHLPDGPFLLEVFLSTPTALRSLAFQVQTFNPDFTSFELWLRVSLVFFAFIFVCWFMHSMRKWSTDEWNLEQGFTCICLCGLIFYDDPLFGVQLLKSSSDALRLPIIDIVSFSLRTFYLAVMMIFWLSVLHGIRESSRRFCQFYVFKILLVLPLWLLGIAAYTWAMMSYANAPETDTANVVRNLTPILIVQACILGIYLLALFYHFLRSCIEVCRMSYLNVRLTYAAALCLLFIVMFFGLWFSTLAVSEWRYMLFDPILFFYAGPLLGLGLPVFANAHAALSALLYAPAISKSHSPRKDSKPLVLASGSDNEDSDEEVVYEDLKGKRHQYSPVATEPVKVDKPIKTQKFQK